MVGDEEEALDAGFDGYRLCLDNTVLHVILVAFELAELACNICGKANGQRISGDCIYFALQSHIVEILTAIP